MSHPSSPGDCRGHSRRGFTLIEVLVVIAIIAVLAALVFPAMARARAAARTTECQQRLRQVGLATGLYHDSHGMFPGVNCHTSIRGRNPGVSYFWSFHSGLLPYLEQNAIYDRIDFRVSPPHPVNTTAVTHRIEAFLCPSDILTSEGRVNYVVSFGTWIHARGPHYADFDGIYNPQWERPIRLSSVRDGLGQTALFSETVRGTGNGRLSEIYTSNGIEQAGWRGIVEFRGACASASPSSASAAKNLRKGGAWWSPAPGDTAYNHIIVPNQGSCTWRQVTLSGGIAASSRHSGGVNLVLADGGARFVSQQIDASIWWALGSINAGETISNF